MPRNAHLARFFEISSDLLCVAGLDGYVKELNPAWEATLGYSRDELMQRPFMEFVHPGDAAAVMSAFLQAAGGEQTESLECRVRASDGSCRWLRWSANYILEDGLIFGVARDVTELRTNEESERESAASFGLLVEAVERKAGALWESEARFQAVFESAAVGIAVADMAGQLLEVNHAYA
jgi:PAS domain S-box-containing protein